MLSMLDFDTLCCVLSRVQDSGDLANVAACSSEMMRAVTSPQFVVAWCRRRPKPLSVACALPALGRSREARLEAVRCLASDSGVDDSHIAEALEALCDAGDVHDVDACARALLARLGTRTCCRLHVSTFVKAIRWNRCRVLDALLDALETSDDFLKAGLQEACRSGNASAGVELLARFPQARELVRTDGTFLSMASYCACVPLVRALLRAGSAVDSTALCWLLNRRAIQGHQRQVMDELLRRGAPVTADAVIRALELRAEPEVLWQLFGRVQASHQGLNEIMLAAVAGRSRHAAKIIKEVVESRGVSPENFVFCKVVDVRNFDLAGYLLDAVPELSASAECLLALLRCGPDAPIELIRKSVAAVDRDCLQTAVNQCSAEVVREICARSSGAATTAVLYAALRRPDSESTLGCVLRLVEHDYVDLVAECLVGSTSVDCLKRLLTISPATVAPSLVACAVRRNCAESLEVILGAAGGNLDFDCDVLRDAVVSCKSAPVMQVLQSHGMRLSRSMFECMSNFAQIQGNHAMSRWLRRHAPKQKTKCCVPSGEACAAVLLWAAWLCLALFYSQQ